MSIIIFDNETTGLLRPIGNKLIHQPHMTEIYALRVTDEFEFEADFYTLVKPPIPIPHFLEQQIGITNEMVRTAPIFTQIYPNLVNIFTGCHTWVGHNLYFDEHIIKYECQRVELDFPEPDIKFCTVEQSMHIKGHRMTNTELYFLATGEELTGAHQAKNDVYATFESFKWLMRGYKNA